MLSTEGKTVATFVANHSPRRLIWKNTWHIIEKEDHLNAHCVPKSPTLKHS